MSDQNDVSVGDDRTTNYGDKKKEDQKDKLLEGKEELQEA